MWSKACKFVDGTVRWTHNKPKLHKVTGEPVYPDDRAAGVGILLSPHAQQQYMGHDSPCERITRVSLKGPVTNLFVIGVYIPHRARNHPCQEDTMSSLVTLLKQVPKQDCAVVLGDFNEELPSCQTGLTGKWTCGDGSGSANADLLMEVMRMFDLHAINILRA